MRLVAEGDDAAFLHRPQGGQALGAVRMHAFVGFDAQRLALAARQHHRLQPAALQAAVVGERGLVLLPAQQGQLIERGAGHGAVARHVLRGGDHRLARVRIGGEAVEDPVLGRRAATHGRAARIDEQRAVAGAVGRDHQRQRVAVGLDLRRGGDQAGHRRGAGLCDQRPADVGEAEPCREPRRAVEAVRLRDRHAEHDPVECAAIELARGQRIAGHGRGEIEAGHIGQAALPAHERRRPEQRQGKGGMLEFHAPILQPAPQAPGPLQGRAPLGDAEPCGVRATSGTAPGRPTAGH